MLLEDGLLSLLACPLCKGDLQRSGDGRALHCGGCRVAYPVEKGVADLLPESARPLDLAPKSP